MKILYVGTLNPFGTCYSRLLSLKQLEPDVHGFDIDPYIDWLRVGRIHRSLETHLLRGPRLSAANRALLKRCAELRPDVVWIDTGSWVWPSTLRTLKSQGCFLVQHITDALHAKSLNLRVKRRLLNATAPLYDVFFTSNVDDQREMAGTSPPTALLMDLGYDADRFEPSPLSDERAKEWSNDLVFIGHYEPHTEAGVLALVDAGLPVTVFGHAPWFASKHRARLGDRLRPVLGNEEYVCALKGASIGLCWVSEVNYNQTASRSFEIPACGTFLLGVRTPQHLECYEEGVEAEFFGDDAELVEKARYYLEHAEEREAIARRGLERCNTSGYSWDGLMARGWPEVKRLRAERAGS